jgi:hypothetical protein
MTSEKLLSVRRSSTSTIARMSAPTSLTTWAVWRVERTLTGLTLSSTQPTQSSRPLATISTVPSTWRVSRCPRFWRRITKGLALSSLDSPSWPSRSRICVLSAAL